MGGQYEVKDGATKKYYSIAGMMVAVNDGTGLQYLLTDHLGSTVAVTNSSGTLTSQQRYLPFGEARSIPNSPIGGTDFTYTGQRMLDSGMGGIMDYKARFYTPYLNRFLQPDTVIPDQSNPQSWSRFSYVLNRPTKFNDPTGHQANCDPEDTQCKEDAKNADLDKSLKYALEKKYKINIRGNWTAAELKILRNAMQSVSNYVGGDANLNAAILAAAKRNKAQATSINIDRIAQSRWNLGTTSPAGPSVAAWCKGSTSYTCSENSMVVADDALSLCYQQSTCGGPAHKRSGQFSNEQYLQFSIVHEFGHILSDANPDALKNYQGTEEAMANELADHIVSGGNISTPFTKTAATFWNPNWSQPSLPLPKVVWE
jgi:RHS repeat-associated protein